MPTPVNKPKRRLRLPRYSMKAMFIAITIFCVVFALVVRPAEQRKRAVASLRAINLRRSEDAYQFNDLTVIYDYEEDVIGEQLATASDGSSVSYPIYADSPPGPLWLHDLIGIDYFADVVFVEYYGSEIRDHDLRQLRHFNELKKLHIWECDSITVAGFKHLTRLESLTDLVVEGHLAGSWNERSDRANRLTTLPPEIGNLTNLTELSLYANNITALPPEFGKLTQLKKLFLGYNQLTELSREFWQLTELTELDLDGNQLTALPPEVGKLKALRSLDLGSNPLTNLPSEIGQLTNLTRLGLGHTQLTELPPEIEKLTNLTDLTLTSSPITDADLAYLKSLKNLEVVRLRDTKVTAEGVADLNRSLPTCEIWTNLYR